MFKLATKNISDSESDTDSLSSSGLTANPFADDNSNSSSFFMGGDRRSVLDEVVHLCQFSNNIVAVLGEAGVGKTMLVNQAVEELSSTAHCCVIQASVMTTPESLLRELAEKLGVFFPETETAERMIELLAQYRPTSSIQRVVVLVDDAHHLNDASIVALINILQSQMSYVLHLLLVGDSSLLLRLDQLETGNILTYDIPLCPLTLDELNDYLSFKLAEVGYQGVELFDSQVVESLWRETRGIPASINRAASRLLMDHSEDELQRPLGLPMFHMIVVVFLLAALIMAVFYRGEWQADSAGGEIAEAPEEDVVIETLPAVEATPELEVASDPDDVTSSLFEEEPLPNTNEVQLIPEVDISVEPQATPVDEEQEEPPVAKPDVNSEESSENDSEQLIPLETPVSVAPQAPKNQPLPPTTVQETQVDNSSSRLTADEQQVAGWPPESFVLQILGASQLDAVKTYVSQQSNAEDLKIVALSRNGQPWYIVLIGVFSDLDIAKNAISALPSSQANAPPWPRKLSDIQSKMINK